MVGLDVISDRRDGERESGQLSQHFLWSARHGLRTRREIRVAGRGQGTQRAVAAPAQSALVDLPSGSDPTLSVSAVLPRIGDV